MQEAQRHLSQSVVVRQSIPNDASLLAGLITQLAAHRGDKATTNQDRLKADLFASSPWAIAFVAERDARLLGYALLFRLYNAQFARRALELHHLFVVPSIRNSGIAKALIRVAVIAAKAEDCVQLVVGTYPDNHRAQSFYRKLGFQDALPTGPRFKLRLDTDV